MIRKLNELESKDLANAIESYLRKRLELKGYVTLYNVRTQEHLTKICKNYGFWDWAFDWTKAHDQIEEIIANIKIL